MGEDRVGGGAHAQEQKKKKYNRKQGGGPANTSTLHKNYKALTNREELRQSAVSKLVVGDHGIGIAHPEDARVLTKGQRRCV